MLKLAIIGTGNISHQFIEACQLSKAYQLTAVYSRKLETARAFAKTYEPLEVFDNLEQFWKADFDVVYIASPNAIHFEQAKQAITAQKHVIVEKPAFSNPRELRTIIDLAVENHVFFFEAARNYHEKAFKTIEAFLADQTILGADFSYAKYSSKMKDLLGGKNPNVFSAKFSGGSLSDLGIYPVYAAIRLFGQPTDANYTATQLKNTVDLNGNGNLIYPDFHVSIRTGKNYDVLDHAEIYTSQGTLHLNHIQGISSAVFQKHDGSKEKLTINAPQHLMLDEVLAFASAIENKDLTAFHTYLNAALAVNQVLYQMRQSAGIIFEADQK